jgi:protein-S-isoprenylcysteine O-methyltransferase Ste14
MTFMSGDGRVLRSYILVIIVYGCLIPLLIASVGPRLDRLLGIGPLMPAPYHAAAGAAALAYAWFWIIWAQVSIVTRGEGHPNEILGYELGPVTQRLVVEGPYRYTRNPMAYGLIVYYFVALAFLRNSVVTLVLLVPACLFEVWYHRTYEEPGLLRRFGSEYERYRERVPLLLPFVTRRPV